MTVVCNPLIAHGHGRRFARIGIAALAAAALGLTGISGTLAQEESMPGEAVAPAVVNETAPAPDELGGPLGEDVVVTEVTPAVLEVPTASMEDGTAAPVPEEIVSVLEDVAAPVDLTAIFGEGFPFTEETETDSTIGGDITLGGPDGGMISVGDDGDVTIGSGVSGESSG